MTTEKAAKSPADLGTNALRFMLPATFYAVLEALFRALHCGLLLYVIPLAVTGALTQEVVLNASLVLVLIFLFRGFFAVKSHSSGMLSGYRSGAEFRIKIGEHLRHLPMSFFADKSTGKLVNTIFQDVELVEMMGTHFYPRMVFSLSAALFTLGILAIFNWPMALVGLGGLLACTPLMLGVLTFIGEKGKKRLEIIDQTNSAILEYVRGIKVFKAFNITGERFARLDQRLRDLRGYSVRFELKGIAALMFYAFILETCFVVMMALGLQWYLQRSLGMAEYFSILVVAISFFRPLLAFSEFASLTRYFLNGLVRIRKILAEKPQDGDDAKLPGKYMPIEFDKVSFGYNQEPVIRDVCFKASPGSMTALVGKSGAGKSTITNLIARFWDVDQGRIRIGETDIRDLPPDHLLANIGMVFQKVYLFNDSIYNNIIIGDLSADQEKVEQAARAANCHEFISKLPQGYQTRVGEGGSTLSGGEKQRLAIARTILKDPPIILMDEATASLDLVNENLVQQAVDNLVKSKTLVVIAHRLRVIAEADQILVLDDGTIAERGNHRQLMEANGIYAGMWRKQNSTLGWRN